MAEPKDEPVPPAPTLGYAERPSGRTAAGTGPAAAVMGTIAGLFGAVVLVYALGAVWQVLRPGARRFDGEDLFAIALALLIGAACLFASFRWIRHAFRGERNAGRGR